jgi:peptidoglycan hydrolase-like protein with peptidoglycan-binding domain
MPVSGNGWPLSPGRGFRTVPGTNTRLEVVNGPAGDILMYVAEQFHKRVEPLTLSLDDWGYSYRANVNNPTQWSNHASATAIDLNAIKHANGLRGTFSSAQVAEIRRILDEVGGVVRWGGDFRTTKDEMHFEINASAAKVQQAWNRLVGTPTTTNPPTTPPTTTPAKPTLEPGATGTDVELVQRFLGVANSGDPGYGHFGPATTAAVQRYQRQQGLVSDGIVGPRTWERILSGLSSNPSGSGGSSVPGRATLGRGSRGEAVSELQRYLNKVYPSYSKLAVDGDYGPSTERVVQEFQRRSGLRVTGIVDSGTWKRLGFS